MRARERHRVVSRDEVDARACAETMKTPGRFILLRGVAPGRRGNSRASSFAAFVASIL